MITTVLFDLDGTLLPMDMDVFISSYFGKLARHLGGYGIDTDLLIKAVWAGTAQMIKNDGTDSNEHKFWACVNEIFGYDVEKEHGEKFEEFYNLHFDEIAKDCGFNPKSVEIIRRLKEKGIKTILATNPVFPKIATEKRIHWAGLVKDDFLLFTTYENSRYSKPNPNYYQDILDECGLVPEECLMVGNDTTDDMIAETLGIKVFLLTDCLYNKKGKDISIYPRGGFDDLWNYIDSLTK